MIFQAVMSLLMSLLKLLLEYAKERRRLTDQERGLAEQAQDKAVESALLRIQQARHEINLERQRVRETYEAARRRRDSGG